MLCSAGDGDARLHVLPYTHYDFRPLFVPSTVEGGNIVNTSRLLELVVLSDSPDCPDPTLCSTEDGHFHTGDLFIEDHGKYTSMGRDDDWIKSENSLRCDTKYVRDVIYNCRSI